MIMMAAGQEPEREDSGMDENNRAPSWEDFIRAPEDEPELDNQTEASRQETLPDTPGMNEAMAGNPPVQHSPVKPRVDTGAAFQDLCENSQQLVERHFRVGGSCPAAKAAGPEFEDSARQQTAALLKAFERIGAPLITAVSEVQSWSGPETDTPEQDAELLARLISTTVSVSQKVADRIGAQQHPDADWVRWSVAAVMSPVVATQYRVTGKPLNDREADRIVSAVDAVSAFAADYTEGGYGRSALELDDEPAAGLRIKAVNALVPVIGAIARFAFGHSEQKLIRDVLQALQERVDRVTARLLDTALAPEERARFELGILNAAGQLYAECHYAEMDRLLDMSAEERADYAQEHNNTLPMGPVWDAFDLRMEMLMTVATHLRPTQNSRIHPPEEE